MENVIFMHHLKMVRCRSEEIPENNANICDSVSRDCYYVCLKGVNERSENYIDGYGLVMCK